MENSPKIIIHYRKVAELKPADYNPRTLTEEQGAALKQSIERFGFVDPIVINTFPMREGIVIGGHQRLEIAKLLGIEEVPCVYMYLDLEQEKELNIRLNKNNGEWDADKLANFFTPEFLGDVGFTKKQLAHLMDMDGGEGKPRKEVTFMAKDASDKDDPYREGYLAGYKDGIEGNPSKVRSSETSPDVVGPGGKRNKKTIPKKDGD